MSSIVTKRANGREYLQRVVSYRDKNGKPKTKVVEHLGSPLPPAGVEAAIWSKRHTLGHITISNSDPLVKEIKQYSGTLPCYLVPAGKFRNGKERMWCRTHQYHFGRKGDIQKCGHADLEMEVMWHPPEINPRRYPGQLAIWYALPPMLTIGAPIPEETGIHIHGRVDPDGKKTLDRTFPCVLVAVPDSLDIMPDWIVITPPAAESWLYATENDIPMTVEKCRYCSTPHLDLGYFAQKPHRMHLCGNCGREFRVQSHTVSNPLSLLATALEKRPREYIPAPDSLNINSLDYPGGIEIWASTPAILWISDKPQQTGIHVHAYDDSGKKRLIDETFAEVTLDGKDLSREELIQTALHRYHKPLASDMYTANPADLT
jgi:hypothetical protein